MVGLLIYLAKRPEKQGKTDVRALTYGALCMAMSFVLSYIKLYSMPLGGSVKNLQLGSVIGVAGRWICHILSGAIFFAEWVPEGWSNAWVYSAAYNGAYLLVDLIICIVLSFVLAKALDKIPTGRK